LTYDVGKAPHLISMAFKFRRYQDSQYPDIIIYINEDIPSTAFHRLVILHASVILLCSFKKWAGEGTFTTVTIFASGLNRGKSLLFSKLSTELFV